MAKRILLTGGAGFIGSHVAQRLAARGDQLLVLDNFDPFYSKELKLENLAQSRRAGRIDFAECDISDTAALQYAVANAGVTAIDAIVHLAAKAGVRPSIEDPLGYQRVNVIGTQNMLDLARRLGASQFVFASSSSVYGVSDRLPWSEEEAGLRPISPYASTKVAGELMGHVYAHLYGLRFVALRFFTVYGPRQRPDLAIRKFAELMLAGKELPFFGDGSSRRDYTFIDDIVQGVCAAVDYSGSPYEVINLGNNRTVSLSEMIAALELELECTARLRHLPSQPGDVPATWANTEKAQALLGFRAQTDLAQGLKPFIGWLRGVHREGV